MNAFNTDIRKVDRSKLKDINDIRIDTTLPCEERLESYVAQVGNPYCYLDNGVVVGIGYADTTVSLQDRLKAFACSLD